MSTLSKKELKERYPDSDIDFLLMMIENRNYMLKFFNSQDEDVSDICDSFSSRVRKLYSGYFSSKLPNKTFKRTDFIDMKEIRKKVASMVPEYYNELLSNFFTSASRVYNYQRLYYLWMLDVKVDTKADTFSKPKPIGEMDSGDDDDETAITDPGATKEIMKEVIDGDVYGRTTASRFKYGIDKSLEKLDALVQKYYSQDGTYEYDEFLSDFDNVVSKQLRVSAMQAHRFGLENAESLGEGLVMKANEFFIKKYQRVEVLDRRSCSYCARLDGSINEKPLGRMHPRCRGMDVPVFLDDNNNIVYRKGIRGRRRRSDARQRWFDNLSEKSKKSIFGKKKYESYKNGTKSFDELFHQKRPANETFEQRLIEKLDKLKPLAGKGLDVAKKIIAKKRKALPEQDISKLNSLKKIASYRQFIKEKEALIKAVKEDSIDKFKLEKEVRDEKVLLNKLEKQMRLTKALKRNANKKNGGDKNAGK